MKVVIIGGGAAGMMAACAAAENGAQVILLEKNEKLGKKIYITGKGRCNLTNLAEGEAFLNNIPRNPRFLYSSLRRWNNQDMIRFLTEQGLALKEERGQRIFPQSDKASDVTAALARVMRDRGVSVKLNCEVTELITEEGRIRGVLFLENNRPVKLEADRVILATGGLSYPATGSTGDGYLLAQMLGHRVEKTFPALVPIETEFSEKISGRFSPADFSGLSLRNVALSASVKEKKRFSEQGEMLFTHFGISGPLVLSCSSLLTEELNERPEQVKLAIDFKPALTRETLKARIIREAGEAGSAQMTGFLKGYLPRALVAPVLAQAGIPETRKAAELGREERNSLIDTLKAFPLCPIGTRGFAEAIITRGGLSVADFDPKTMESRRTKGLYAAGELLDVDGLTGGFNLQIAWTTGYAAGCAAAREERIVEKEKRVNRHIAIDGPASSGKSTIAKRVAEETGLIYVDTGAMYRAMAVYFLRQGLAAEDETGITAACAGANVSIAYENGAQQVYLNGENVTPILRDEATGQMASASSAFGAVREKMTQLQQLLAKEKDVVMDGRDIGTVVLPDAFLKIFMTASAEVRAARRTEELLAKGVAADYETVKKEIIERDWRDSHRAIAPLRQAEDAVLLDTSELSIEEVTARVLALYRGKEE